MSMLNLLLIHVLLRESRTSLIPDLLRLLLCLRTITHIIERSDHLALSMINHLLTALALCLLAHNHRTMFSWTHLCNQMLVPCVILLSMCLLQLNIRRLINLLLLLLLQEVFLLSVLELLLNHSNHVLEVHQSVA